jgi:molecular chaperone GrpE (heat shock protein)
MARKHDDEPYIWDDESGEPCPMTIEEFDARLDASNVRRQQEIEEAQARNRELEGLLARKEALLARLQATFEETKRESEAINARVAALSAASRRALRATSSPQFSRDKSSVSS